MIYFINRIMVPFKYGKVNWDEASRTEDFEFATKA